MRESIILKAARAGLFCMVALTALLGSSIYTPAQIITTYAGNGVAAFAGDNGPATAASLRDVNALAADKKGNIYIGDLSRVRKVSKTGIMTTFAGNGFLEINGFPGANGPATASAITNTNGLAADKYGNVYLTDQQRIKKVDTNGIITLYGGNGLGGYIGNGGPATAAEFNNPRGIVADTNGNLYIADMFNSRIRKIDAAGYVSTIAGTGQFGDAGDGGAAIYATFGYPSSLAIDSHGNLYVSDEAFYNIRKIDPSGTITRYAGGGGDDVSGGPAINAYLPSIQSITADDSDNLYIVNYSSNDIDVINKDGFISVYAGNGTAGYTGDGGAANEASLNYPQGIAAGDSGYMYIADEINYVVRRAGAPVFNHAPVFTSGNEIYTSTCQGSGTVIIDSNLEMNDVDSGQTETWSVFYAPTHGTISGLPQSRIDSTISMQPAGVTYTPDPGFAGEDFAQVRVFDGHNYSTTTLYFEVTPTSFTISGPGDMAVGGRITFDIQPYSNGVWSSSDNNIATTDANSTFGGAPGVVYIKFSTTNDCGFVSDSMLVNVHDNSPIITTFAGLPFGGGSGTNDATTTALQYTYGVASDNSGNIYISDKELRKVYKVNSANQISTYAGNGDYDTYGNGGAATDAALSEPAALAIDKNNNLYIADRSANEVRKVDASGNISLFVSAADLNNNRPSGLAVDTSGNVYISEGDDNRVIKVSPGGTIQQFAGDGTYGHTGDNGPALNAHLSNPNGLATDSAGNVYIAQGSYISKVNTSGIISTFAGSAVAAGYGGDSGPALSAHFTDVFALATDRNGNLYLSDNNKGVIRRIDHTGIVHTFSGNGDYFYHGDNGAALSAGIANQVYGLATDPVGNVYLTDGDYGNVRKITIGSNNAPVFDDTTNTSFVTCEHSQSVSISALLSIRDQDAGQAEIWSTAIAPHHGTLGFGAPGTSNTGVVVAQNIAYTPDSGYAGTDTFTIQISDGYASAVKMLTATINPLPHAGMIAGTSPLCPMGSVALHDPVAGGVWTSNDSSILIVNVAGVVTGVSAGNTTVKYSVTNSCGVDSTQVAMVVNPLPDAGAIFGSHTVCVNANTMLTDASGGGVWTSTNTSVATVNNGSVHGITAGVTTISYTVTNSCGTDGISTSVTVNPLPDAGSITGGSAVCAGSSIPLIDAAPDGVWSSSDNNIATVDVSGHTWGAASGTANISYTVTNSCGAASAMHAVAVSVPGAGVVTGNTSVCVAATTALTDNVTGGAWTSSNTTVATISAAGLVRGVSGGTTNISYTLTNTCGVFSSGAAVTVTALPDAGTIIGGNTVCAHSALVLSDAANGGAWTSNNTAAATVDASGLVTGVAAGTATISYTVVNGCGTSRATKAITVNALPNAGAIAGPTHVSVSSTIMLTDNITGGVWSSNNTAIATIGASGLVSGVAQGSVGINYVVSNSCGSATATATVSVDSVATAGTIMGNTTVCTQLTTSLTSTVPGGTWSSSNAAIASIGAGTGVVTGVSAGTATITYTMSAGVFTTATVTVKALSPTNGLNEVCQGQTITLTNSTPGGGVWSATFASSATVSNTGVVTGGVVPQTTVINFTAANGCVAGKKINVYAIAPITGPVAVCVGQAIMLSNAVTGGTWSSLVPAVATVASATSGNIGGIATGTATIKYTTINGCISNATVTVNPLAATTGNTAVCTGSSITLANGTTGGGTWSSDNTAVATVGITSAVVGGVSGGSAVISFTTIKGCVATRTVTVGATAPITGPASVCVGQTIALSNTIFGGTWTSSVGGMAGVGVSSGIVTGVAAGSPVITYMLSINCVSTKTITVNPLSATTGSGSLCQGGATITLVNSTPGGGTWSSANTIVATVGLTTAVVTGLSGGTADINFTTVKGCVSAKTVTVTATAPMTGPAEVCAGQSITLANAIAGGTWSSSIAGIAGVGINTGVVNGASAGVTTISYSLPGSCVRTASVTVDPLSQINGSSTVCLNHATTMTNGTTGGGTWSSSNTLIASAGITSGIVTGNAAGGATITFTTIKGCVATKPLTVTLCGPREADPAAVDATTSIARNVSMFPNPNKGTFTVKGLTNEDQEFALTVVDMLGQVIYRGNVKTTNGILDEQVILNSNLANGMYMLDVRTGDEHKVFHFVIAK